jgi:hypothetical protein
MPAFFNTLLLQMVLNSLFSQKNREFCSEFLRPALKIPRFCPESASSVGEQGISREFRKFAAKQEQLWT